MSSPASTAEPRMKKRKSEESGTPVNDDAAMLVETATKAASPAKAKPHTNSHPSQALAEEWRATLAKQALPSAISSAGHAWHALPSAISSAGHAWHALPASRLKQFSSPDVELRNRLLAARLHGVWSESEAKGEGEGDLFQWEVIEHTPIASPVFASLGIAGEASPHWQIGISEHASLLPWLPQPFATLTDSAKHLCLTIALAPLLAALKETFELPAELVGIVPAALTPELAKISIRAVRSADTPGDTIGDIVELVLPHDTLEAIINRYVPRNTRAEALLPALQVHLPVCVAVANLPLQTVLDLKVSDVVLFERGVSRVDELPLFLCAGNTGLSLINRNGVLSVDTLFPLNQFHHEPEGFFMNQARAAEKNESADSTFTPSVDQASTLVDVKSVPVTLQFEIGRLSLTVQEVSDLAKGTVIQLPRKLSPETVTIRANGRSFATGEIVHIDDQLGVKITSIANAPAG
jgi:type III secretion system YscQ/HrcQ family protein